MFPSYWNHWQANLEDHVDVVGQCEDEGEESEDEKEDSNKSDDGSRRLISRSERHLVSHT